MAHSTNSEKRYRGGKGCVAGGPNLVSCANTSKIEGISMHLFPHKETDLQRRQKWVNFVRKHRPGFHASATSCLCSAHFDDSCYDVNLALAKALNMKRRLKEDAVPTIDLAGIVSTAEEQPTDRRRRQIIRRSKRLSPIKLPLASSNSPTAVDEQSRSPTSHAVDDSVYDVSYDSDTEIEFTSTSHSSGTSCDILKKRIKGLQKTISWYKKTKAALHKPIRRLEAENKTSVPSTPTVSTAVLDSDEDSEKEIYSDDESLMDYSSLEEFSQSAAEMDDITRNTVSVDEGTSPYNEPMFMVSYSPLIELFGRFCFNCKAENPKVQVKRIRSMASVVQACIKCLKENFTWRSQSIVMGRHAAGNIMTSFGILMSGISISQAMLMFKHMNLATISVWTYHVQQSSFLFPAILKHWEVCQSGLIEEVKKSDEGSQTWSGDGRFDSMGHSAKYGVYTMWSNTTSKLVHFELLQANELGSSNAMELEGAKRSFKFLKESGLAMDIFISD